MQVAIVCAGFTPSEADALRRSMATFKFTGGVHHFRDKMIAGMVERGYTQEFAEKTFSQIEGFGSYGFPESHAASFALIAYASSWLKCHHPDVFCCALLNAQPMGFYAPAQIVRDARLHGVDGAASVRQRIGVGLHVGSYGWEVPGGAAGVAHGQGPGTHACRRDRGAASRRADTGRWKTFGGARTCRYQRWNAWRRRMGSARWASTAARRFGRSAACRMRDCRCSILKKKGPEEVDEKEKEHPLPLRERAGGRGGYNLCPRPGVPLPPAASLKGRGSPLPLPLLSTNPPSISPPWPPGVRWWKTTAPPASRCAAIRCPSSAPTSPPGASSAAPNLPVPATASASQLPASCWCGSVPAVPAACCSSPSRTRPAMPTSSSGHRCSTASVASC